MKFISFILAVFILGCSSPDKSITSVEQSHIVDDISMISLHIEDALTIPDHIMAVEIRKLRDSIHVHSSFVSLNSNEKIKTAELDTIFSISQGEFNILSILVKSISSEDLESFTQTKDHNTHYDLKFGDGENLKSYQLWSSPYNFKERKANTLVKAIDEILKVAKLVKITSIDIAYNNALAQLGRTFVTSALFLYQSFVPSLTVYY